MGYYSEVVISFDRETHEKELFLQTFPIEMFDEIGMTQEKYDRYFSYYIRNYKWYESYVWVRAIMYYLNSQPKNTWQFLRVGENDGDVEWQGELDTDYYTETAIKH